MKRREPYRRLFIMMSICIPLLIILLFRVKILGYDFSYLPHIYVVINVATAVLLLLALWAVKNEYKKLHEVLIKICLGLSSIFLVMYLLYHMTTDATVYGGEGVRRYIYFFFLITHILLSIIAIPMVLFTLGRALVNDYDKHRKFAKFAFPVWLYVAITGVLVYVMISPYYV